MEHTKAHGALALAARLLRRRWCTPLQVVGAAGALVLLTGLSSFRLGDERARHRALEPQELVTDGVVRSARGATLRARFDGTLRQVEVRFGDRVRKGQLLFTMDEQPLRQALAAARSREADERAGYAELLAQRARDLAELKAQAASVAAELYSAREALYRSAYGAAAGTEDQGEEDSRETREHDASSGDQPDFYRSMAADLGQQFASLQAAMAERAATWGPVLAEAHSRCAAAAADVRRRREILASAVRCSPIDGVVTGVYAGSSCPLSAGAPVVRVDDPSHYRVVTRVDESLRDALRPGMRLSIRRGKVELPAAVSRVVPGWDKDLFHYWVWLKPTGEAALRPDEPVEVVVPEGVRTAMAFE